MRLPNACLCARTFCTVLFRVCKFADLIRNHLDAVVYFGDETPLPIYEDAGRNTAAAEAVKDRLILVGK